MYVLDTDHLSVLDRGGVATQKLLQRLANIEPTQVATSIISYEEQMRGWLSYAAKAQTVQQSATSRFIQTTKAAVIKLLCYPDS